jgi:hypothetical protein
VPSISYGPIDLEDDVGGVLVICKDVTTEHNTKEDLKRRALQLERLLEQAPSFIAILRGSDHVFELVNAAYKRLLGDRAHYCAAGANGGTPQQGLGRSKGGFTAKIHLSVNVLGCIAFAFTAGEVSVFKGYDLAYRLTLTTHERPLHCVDLKFTPKGHIATRIIACAGRPTLN